jgi:hypothetical protein
MGEFKFSKYIGLAALGLSGAVYAAPPTVYDGWTVTNGTINAPCPVSGAAGSCGAPMTDKGFLQREIVIGGTKYIQTIITDSTATAANATAINNLPFANEDFVRSGSAGYAGKMSLNTSESTVATPNIADKMTYSSLLNTGWALGASDNLMTLNQTVSTVDSTTAASPVTTFTSSANIIQKDTVETNRDLTLDQTALLTSDGGKQKFLLHSISGTLQTTSHTATGATPDPVILAGGTSGGNISWAAGDQISATWIGQTIPSAPSTFGYTRFASPTGDTYLRDFSSTAPAGTTWLTVFGTAPTF